MRVAIVHDRLTEFGGAERTALAIRRIWPDAAVYAGVADLEAAKSWGFGDVTTSALQRLPLATKRPGWVVGLEPLAFSHLHLPPVDLVISSSFAFAKCVVAPRGAAHLCYCHTPGRALWQFGSSHLREQMRSPVKRAAALALVRPLRWFDRRGALRVDQFVATSTFVAAGIEQAYGRTSVLVPPPVEVERYAGPFERKDHLVLVSRLFPYKQIDQAIRACNDLGLHLVIVGTGQDRARLEALAGPTVELRGWVDEAEKVRLVGTARALLAPQVEDFGIVMVEALAAGTPVVAVAAGGALDIVDHGRTGLLYHGGVSGLRNALLELPSHEFDSTVLQSSAARFSEARFADGLRQQAEALLAGM